MAGIGSAWGSREEMLHPRDRHGRFRKKWKMAAGVVDALSSFLDRFQPHSFQSDQQASQYAFNRRKAPWSTPELQRLHMDWDEANGALQAGKTDPTTKRFTEMMDRNMVETTDDLIVSQTVPVESFGLSPQQAAMEDGGLEDLIGLEIADAGYSATNLGSELSHPPGSVTLRVAVPKGTRVAYGGRSPNDRAVIFDRDQPLVVTKVEPDGRGGWYMLAIAGSGARTKGATAVADDRTHGTRGAALTPEQREARISPQMSGESRLQIAQREQQQNEAATLLHQREVQGAPPGPTETPVPQGTPAPAPAAPASPQTPASPATGVPERREPVHSNAVGPGSPEGRSASEVAQMGEESKAAAAAEAATPQAPTPPTPLEFQEAARDLSVPTAGKQRSEWNKAHSDLSRGKRDPGDVLRELDTDIEENKRQAAGADHAEKKDTLERNIQAQEQLADLIAEKYGLQRRGREAKGAGDGASPTPTPAVKKTPRATPGAPSTKREATPKAPAPKKAVKRAPQDVADQMKSVKTREEGDALLEGLTGPELHAVAESARIVVPKRATKDKLKQTIRQHGYGRRLDSDAISGNGQRMRDAEAARVAKKAAPEAPATPVKKVAKKAAPEAPAAPVKAAKKAAPAKAVPEVSAEDEAFKARVTEAGLPDKVADLRAQAREKKIRGFSTMNKRQLQSALLGDEVPKAGKIAPVSPQKLVPHLKAAESDQEARKLLENHTLADLKALAQHRELEVPKRGATKDKLKDAVLANIRGVPEGAGGETPARSLRQELSAQKWVTPENPAAASKVRGIIDDTDEMDAAELRGSRDDLEKYSKELRAGGNRQDANLVQTLADTMGMRAQVISGVEEGPARAPAKRAVKKAVPAVPEGEVPPKTLDQMLKPELAQVAAVEGVPGIRKSMTKPQLKEAIERHRRAGGRQSEEDRLRQELEAVPVEAPAAAPAKKAAKALSVPDRAPTPEEIARDAAPTAPPAKRAKARALKRVPEGSVEGPRAAEKLDSEPRKSAFQEAWDGEGFADDPSLTEIRDDIASGKISQEEGVRRIQSEISFNEEEISDLGAQLEGMAPEDRDEESGVADAIHARRAELQDKITSQKKAAKFLRDHARDEAPVTRQELEVKLDGPEKAALDRVDVDSLKEAARQEGLGEIEGDDKDALIQNISKAIARRELDNREKERRARDRQTSIDESGKVAEALSNLDQMAQNGGSDKALQAGIRRLPAADREQLTEALGDRDLFRQRLDTATKGRGLARFGTVGETVPYDPQKHDVVGDVAPGSPVLITRAGHDFRPGDGSTVSFKARAIPDAGTPATKAAVPSAPEAPAAPAKKALPGAAPGTAAGKITAGRVVPGHRIMVKQDSNGDWKTAQNKTGAIPVEVTEVRAGAGGRRQFVGRDDQGNEIEILGHMGQSRESHASHQTLMLEPAPKAPKATKAAVSTPEAPAAPAKKAAQAAAPSTPETISARLSDIENPPSQEDARAMLDGLQRRDLNKMAGDLQIPGRGSMSNDELKDEIYEATAGRLAAAKATRGFGGRTPTDVPVRTGDITPIVPAKKVAKAAVPAKATPKPVVDLDNPTRHNAEVIGTGLDLDAKGEDRQWLAAVQSELDAGVDGRQIANSLRRDADASRTGAVLRLGDWVDDREAGPPEVEAGRAVRRAERQAERAKLNARVDRMELMADRLEGVRPIPKPEPAKKTIAQQVRRFDTMQAQSASSKAMADLKAGKSHTEVATALRQAATSVGSRDHDPQLTSRIGDPTPSEMSAIKRSDARALRELADEIRAEGVAQRAAAKATKKAAPKKAPNTATEDAVATMIVDRIQELDPARAKELLAGVSPADRKELDAARERDTARKAAKAAAPKKRTAAEMKRAQALAGPDYPLEQVLADWDRQKEERKNLTGPVGEMIVRQMDDAMRRLQEAKTPAREDDALAGLLAPELKQLAQRLGLDTKGSKSTLLQRIKDRVKGREAPGASAERAVPKAPTPTPSMPGGVDESVPLAQFPHDDNMRMHADSPTMQLAFAYERAGRNGSANRLATLRARATSPVGNKLTPQEVVDELKAIRAQETDPKFQAQLDRAIELNDAPMTPIPDLPADTPPLARQLLEDLHAIPLARKGNGERTAGNTIRKGSLVDQLAKIYWDASRGERGERRSPPDMRMRDVLRGQVHEMNDASFRIWELVSRLIGSEEGDTGTKRSDLMKEISAWERSHWPK